MRLYKTNSLNRKTSDPQDILRLVGKKIIQQRVKLGNRAIDRSLFPPHFDCEFYQIIHNCSKFLKGKIDLIPNLSKFPGENRLFLFMDNPIFEEYYKGKFIDFSDVFNANFKTIGYTDDDDHNMFFFDNISSIYNCDWNSYEPYVTVTVNLCNFCNEEIVERHCKFINCIVTGRNTKTQDFFVERAEAEVKYYFCKKCLNLKLSDISHRITLYNLGREYSDKFSYMFKK